MQSPFQIVGILNVTPDSYVDGGLYTDPEAALRRAEEVFAEGADILDIGGESTGPGSKDVSVDEELSRVLPVLERIRAAHPTAVISVDTCKAEVAREVLDRGAAMINDVTAGRNDAAMNSTLALYKAKFVLMYAKDESPRTTVDPRAYEDVVSTVYDFLESRIAAALEAGIARERIIIDPGLGHFVSSDPSYSFQILRHLHRFAALAPVFVSPSRKSFLAGVENLAVAERLPGTIAASIAAVRNGAQYIRTHDVAAVRRACEIAAAIET